MDTKAEYLEQEQSIILHNESDFAGMRIAGKLAAETLDYITPFVKTGAVTAELDFMCQKFIEDSGAIAAPLGYKGYPKATCISVNHVVCHGIPGERVLKEGDIANIDVTVIVNGWHGDTSRMFYCGKPSVKAKLLVEATYEAMMKGIECVKPGATLGDVGHAIQSYAEAKRFSVVRDFCGHGLGKIFHTQPSVLHYGEPNTGVVLKTGMFFTIEPMINVGKYDVKILDDDWTAVTKDKSLSAQFEHSLAVTETGYEIFTLSPKGYTCPPFLDI